MGATQESSEREKFSGIRLAIDIDLEHRPIYKTRMSFLWQDVIDMEEYPDDDFKNYGEVTKITLAHKTICVLGSWKILDKKWSEYIDYINKKGAILGQN